MNEEWKGENSRLLELRSVAMRPVSEDRCVSAASGRGPKYNDH